MRPLEHQKQKVPTLNKNQQLINKIVTNYNIFF